jgi:polysaccharide export outer membrane protein
MRLSALALAMTIGLSGCAATTSVQQPVANLLPPDPPPSPVLAANYRVNPGDTINVLVFHQPDLSGTFEIGPTGTIAMPLIGDTVVSGLTNTEIASLLSHKLSEKYLQDPQVSVAVKEASSQHFTVDGAVSQPGVYTMVGNMTLLQAIATAHGGSDVADGRKIVIFRVVNGQRVAGVFDINKIRSGVDVDPRIYANDTIVIPVDSKAQTLKNVIGVIPLAAFATFLHL